jgi:hypothetical protein
MNYTKELHQVVRLMHQKSIWYCLITARGLAFTCKAPYVILPDFENVPVALCNGAHIVTNVNSITGEYAEIARFPFSDQELGAVYRIYKENDGNIHHAHFHN